MENETKTLETNILQSIESEFKKSENDAVKAKAKDIIKRKREAEKTARICDIELAKLMDDFKAGII